ncbi:MAG: Rab family GTPase [Promethearchaeota archaeon]
MKRKALFKVIVAGDGGVGKTTLLKRYIDNTFDLHTKMSIGVEIHQKVVEIEDSLKCELIIWDLGGQDHFRFLLDRFVDGASGALLMFDLTRDNTLFNLGQWTNIVRRHDPTLPCILLGGKLDLLENQTYNDEKAIKVQKEINCPHYLKVSSKTGENVNKSFELLVREILKHKEIDIT